MCFDFDNDDDDDDDELDINPPKPCQIGKRPPAPKPKRESAGHQGVAGGGFFFSFDNGCPVSLGRLPAAPAPGAPLLSACSSRVLYEPELTRSPPLGLRSPKGAAVAVAHMHTSHSESTAARHTPRTRHHIINVNAEE